MVWSMRRPVIAICSALERARWAVWDQQAALVPMSYAEAVQRAGGIAVILPPDAGLVAETATGARAVRRPAAGGRHRHRPGQLRPGAASGDRRHGSRARRIRNRAHARGDRAGPARARHLPGHAADQRRLRRHARAAPSRSRGPRGAQARARLLRGRRPRRGARPGLARRERGRRARARDALASPPGRWTCSARA